ncbi:PREDICTED: uncharacterized protein LOC106786506 [Polistes canadensis]|uniref:uncharacterized protein LOC106786506 n=1 Tax=Polistes canadensis TaxID=91411 RepID=UPI000718CCD4|nr:PREDICTED: uncharacterized protein LOC106786506 [Polistes canadensis]
MENVSWLIILSLCGCLADCIDLGPFIRIAQCRSQCLQKFRTDETYDWFPGRQENPCAECWQNCEAVEKRWEEARKTICEQNDRYEQCPACQIACTYRETRVAEKYLPSMLPAPKKDPVTLDKFDVAIVLRKINNEWKDMGYYPGGRLPKLRLDSWIIVITEQGINQYSWQEWVPTLESLKEGLLYEATVSWKDLSTQLRRQKMLQQKKLNDKVKQLFLEKYGEKVLAEWRNHEDSQMSDEVFRRFFFRREDERNDDEVSEADDANNTANSLENPSTKKNESLSEKPSYIVSWEPETGGLIGNQVTESNFVQISLYPGTKYLVRIASNEGPGSFPIEVDTRPNSFQIKRVKIKHCDTYFFWYFYFAFVFLALLLLILLVRQLKKRNNKVIVEDV